MLPDHIAKHLKRAIESGRANLFVGPGFSSEAKNSLRVRPVPTSEQLSELLWRWLGYKEEFDGSVLSEVFDAALRSGRKRDELEAYLRANLLARDVPDTYDGVARLPWNRIYSSSVDNVLETIYARVANAPNLVVKVDGVDDYEERDAVWRDVQCVKLNGDVRQSLQTLNFRPRGSAQLSGRSAWSEHFRRDYAGVTTVFLATQIRDPLVWEYLESRGKRGAGEAESRPRSYLVTRTVSPPKRAILEQLNVHAIEADVPSFLAYVNELFEGQLPDRLKVLQVAQPHLAVLERGGDIRESRRVEKVFSCFRTVPTETPSSPVRGKAYLLGAPPSWEDVLRDLDAARRVNKDLCDLVAKQPGVVVLLNGSAGCVNKSTVLKRVGVNLARAGYLTLHTEGEVFPPIAELSEYLRGQAPSKSVILVDNASMFSTVLARLVKAMRDLGEQCPSMIFATRTNDLDRWRGSLPTDETVVDVPMPHLDDADIGALVDLLGTHGLLGVLEGKARPAQELAFRQLAQRQILVAMREATQGRGVRSHHRGRVRCSTKRRTCRSCIWSGHSRQPWTSS